jgi:hypothetical protein
MNWIKCSYRLPEERHIVKGRTEHMEEDEWLRVCLIEGVWEDDTIDWNCEERYPKIIYWMNYCCKPSE